MSTYLGLGLSRAADAAVAGKEAVDTALRDFGGVSPDIIFVYSTFGYDFAALLKAIRLAGGNAAVVGGTTFGIIAEKGPDTEFHRVSVCAIKSDDFSMTPIMTRGILGRSGAAGRELALAIKASGEQNMRGLYLYLDGLHSSDPDALLRELEVVLPPNTPVFGGTASEPFLWKNTYQFYNDNVLEDAAVGVLFGGKIHIEVISSHGSQELGAVHEVTRAEGARIYEIDQRPAMKLFSDIYGSEQKTINATTAVGVCLGVRPDTIPAGGESVELRIPLSAEEDGSIIMAAAWPVGTKIYICQRDPGRIVDRATSVAHDLAKRHEGKNPLVVFHADCVGRSAEQIGKDVALAEVNATISAFPPGTPWFGAYVYGEIASVGGKPVFHNWTGAIASFYLE